MTIRTRVLYPVLASIYPVLALAAVNAGEWVHLRTLVNPLLISVAACAVFALGAAILTRDADKRALITFTLVLAFASYGYLTVALDRRPTVASFSHDTVALPLVGILVIGAVLSTVYARRSFVGVSRFLNVMTCLLVLFAATSLVTARLRARRGEARSLAPAPPEAPISNPAARRDIYLIVLDKYTGARSLRRNYGLDNSPFVSYLRSRGFFVPEATRANYVHTSLALASLLNWEYLEGLGAAEGPDSHDWEPAFALVEHNRTTALLKRLGYEFVFFPTAYRGTRQNAEADLQIPDPREIKPEFETMWLRTTLLLPLLRAVCRLRACTEFPYVPEPTSLMDWKFDKLGRLAPSGRPRFVLAHLMVPHEPYVYRSDCTTREPFWPANDFGPDSAAMRAAYVEQILCVNIKLRTLVDRLLDAPKRPVILLQSDHGHGRLGWKPPSVESATREQLAERPDIFAAYYVPGAPDSLFYHSISPVNVLPILFHHMFGMPWPLHPDHTYWSSLEEPYRFTRIP